MDKEKLISKIKLKDYNKELENILAKKAFSKDTQNLLLSMLYKIETSYEDYKKIKIEVPSKKELIENILRIIENDCKKITFARPIENNGTPLLKSEITEKEIITYQNELSILKSIYKLDSDKFGTLSQEQTKNQVLENFLKNGQVEFNTEIIRDFDGWSWNTMTNEIENMNAYFVYQSLVYLIGYDKLNQNENENLEELLKEKYSLASTKKLLNIINKIAWTEYLKDNPMEKETYRKKEKNLIELLENMENKKEYINRITEEKKQCLLKIKELDKYLNNDLLLKKEYIKQNEKLPLSERIFSVSDFSEKIQKDREELEKKIEKLTEKLKPKNYVNEKNDIEQRLQFINEIMETDIKEKDFVYELIELLLYLLGKQINKIETKKGIIENIAILRYLNLFYINKNEILGEKYKKLLEKTEKQVITKGCNIKSLYIFSTNVKENFEIYKNIFKTKIIDLESVYIEIDNNNSVKIFDDNSLEKEEKKAEFKELTIKQNKKTKVFI